MFKGGESDNDTLVSSPYHNIGEYCTDSLQMGKCVSKTIETHNFHDKYPGLAVDSYYVSPYNRLKSNTSMLGKSRSSTFLV